MAVQKYKQYYDMMMRNNTQLLADFKKTHDLYATNMTKYHQQFNTEGRDILDIMRSYERKLCSGMERGKNSAYSDKLAEKFWLEIKKEYPLIDQVGVKTRQIKV